ALTEAAPDWWLALTPPPALTISEWADAYRRLSAEDSAEPGGWRTSRTEDLRGSRDAGCDPAVREVIIVKAAQLGGTQLLLTIAGSFIHLDPAPILWVNTTIGESETFSRDRFAACRRDNPAIGARIPSSKARDGENTILDQRFPGGRLLFRGANSPASLRSHPIRVLLMAAVDGDPATTAEGEPTTLAQKRTKAFWTRLIVKCSTPGDAATSRIGPAYEASDKRVFKVPCPDPDCGHEQTLRWAQVRWDKDEATARHKPETAAYGCEACGVLWSDTERYAAVAKGHWEATAPFNGVAGFALNSLLSPFVELAPLAREFLEAKNDPERLRTFVNTELGEVWQENVEVPEWRRLYERNREGYRIGTAPLGVLFLTAGVDVQKDRIEVEVVGWGRNKETWSVDDHVLQGNPTEPAVWAQLAELLEREWPHASGRTLPIRVLGVDSGYATTQVNHWGRRHRQPAWGPAGASARQPRTVASVIGRDRSGGIIVGASPADAARKRGLRVFSIGLPVAKGELYRRLNLDRPTDEELAAGSGFPPGYGHFPQYGEDYFRQLTAEKLVTRMHRGFPRQSWEKETGQRNEALDCRVYARAAAALFGLDRLGERHWRAFEEALGLVEPPQPTAAAADDDAAAAVAADDGGDGARLPRARPGRTPRGLAVAAPPVVDRRRGVAGIDAQHPDRQRPTRGVRPLALQELVELGPDGGLAGVALEDVVVDRPRLLVAAPADDLDLDPVLLDVHAGGQE
ncbi:MAG TPA: terminase gpA endonuclease subunit, partial [Thermoleophilaceae bacterium]|nr:terminase gpA endonuclease subunit [Thermoleophilaceae bacterium]